MTRHDAPAPRRSDLLVPPLGRFDRWCERLLDLLLGPVEVRGATGGRRL